MEYELKMDFYKDWIEIFKQELQAEGYQIDPDESLNDICERYFNVRKRKVAARPRKVLVSKEFTCPPEYQNGLDLIKRKIENGDDLTPHLSRKVITKPDYDDALLNDWGIHHLHLGTKIEDDGFVTRTRPVLYARFTDDFAYFISIMPHGSWSNREIITIVHRNWPESIEKYRLKGVSGIERKIGNADIAAFRKSGVNPILEINGCYYVQPGGGYAASGKSLDVVTNCMALRKVVRRLEKDIKDNIKEYMEDVKKQGREVGDKLEFQLKIDNGDVYAYENQYRIIIPFSKVW